MLKYAILQGNYVTNIVVADNADTALAGAHDGFVAVEYDDSTVVATGYTYDANTKTFSEPERVTPNA
jgi:hypothetical protein